MNEERMRLAPDGPVSRALRAAIRAQGWAVPDLAERAGVSASILHQFVHKQGGLTLATVDLLAAVLRLTLCRISRYADTTAACGSPEHPRPAGTRDRR
jgi:hypothetical protein